MLRVLSLLQILNLPTAKTLLSIFLPTSLTPPTTLKVLLPNSLSKEQWAKLLPQSTHQDLPDLRTSRHLKLLPPHQPNQQHHQRQSVVTRSQPTRPQVKQHWPQV